MLWDEVRCIYDRNHELVGSEVIGGTGEAETDRLPRYLKGCFRFVQHLVAKEHLKQTGVWMDDAMTDKRSKGKAVRKLVQVLLEKYLNNALHDDLHWLAAHRIFAAGAGTTKPPLERD